MRDLYKVKVIEEAIENMNSDEYNLTRLRNDKGKAINIDVEALEVLKAYYEGTDGIIGLLSEEEKDKIYHDERKRYVYEDVLSLLDQTPDIPEDTDIEAVSANVAELFDDGEYDCNLSYWDNLDSLIKNYI